MKKKILLAVLAVMLIANFAGSEDFSWTTGQKILAGTMVVGRAIDTLQTFEILDNPKYYETNKMITDKESAVVVLMGSAAATLLMAHLLPKWRTGILAVANVITWSYVEHNHTIGVRIEF